MPVDGQRGAAGVGPTKTIAPGPRAFHAAWAFDAEVYVHGGEGPVGTTNSTSDAGDGGFDDIIGGVGRDPFAEEDGGAPLEQGRVMVAGRCGGRGVSLMGGGDGGGGGVGEGQRGVGSAKQLREVSKGSTVAVLEDLWKLDIRAVRWERVRAGVEGGGGFRRAAACLFYVTLETNGMIVEVRQQQKTKSYARGFALPPVSTLRTGRDSSHRTCDHQTLLLE